MISRQSWGGHSGTWQIESSGKRPGSGARLHMAAPSGRVLRFSPTSKLLPTNWRRLGPFSLQDQKCIVFDPILNSAPVLSLLILQDRFREVALGKKCQGGSLRWFRS